VANAEKASTTDAPGDSQAGELGDNMGPSTDELDAVTQAPRLTGPGARAARKKIDPDYSEKTLGRSRKD
jgi:hypothetical protein